VDMEPDVAQAMLHAIYTGAIGAGSASIRGC
jgi:hypothetical protein